VSVTFAGAHADPRGPVNALLRGRHWCPLVCTDCDLIDKWQPRPGDPAGMDVSACSSCDYGVLIVVEGPDEHANRLRPHLTIPAR